MPQGLNVPFFMFDIYNLQLITTTQIPGDISDSKGVVLAETPVPGLNYSPITSGGMGNRKLSFTLPLIKKNGVVGNLLMLKQYENLRNQPFLFGTQVFAGTQNKFRPNPKVLFFWGSGSTIPLEYYVAKCDFVHKSQFVNRLGYPQFSEISMELWLDEQSPLYVAEDIARKVLSYAGMALSIVDMFGNNLKDGMAKGGTNNFGKY